MSSNDFTIPPRNTAGRGRPVTPEAQVTEDPLTPTPRKPRPAALASRPIQHFRFESEPKAEEVQPKEETDEELPDASEVSSSSEDSESDSSEEEDSSDEEMSDLVFDGKQGTLDDILTHCQVTFAARPKKFPTDTEKGGFLAAKFRGKALTWLTKNLKDKPKLLEDYDAFKKALSQDFALTEDTRKKAADRRLKTLLQKGSAQSFAIEFDELADILGFDDEAKRTAFQTRLKPEVRRQLIGHDETKYSTLRQKAIEIDEELYALRNPRQRRAKDKGKNAPRDGGSKN
jgi:hypothetical protein